MSMEQFDEFIHLLGFSYSFGTSMIMQFLSFVMHAAEDFLNWLLNCYMCSFFLSPFNPVEMIFNSGLFPALINFVYDFYFSASKLGNLMKL